MAGIGMGRKLKYVKWFSDTGTQLTTADGKPIEVWEFNHQKDDFVLSEWAKHFRNQYIDDAEIDTMVSGTGKTRSQYLADLIFPDAKRGFGPITRAGDWAELLIADYLEYLLNYWVPRTRYQDKIRRNESPKGSDVIGFKVSEKSSSSDEMIIFEVKAKLTNTDCNNKLQEAVDDSNKDEVRQAESLNAIKRKLNKIHDLQSVEKISRFQNKVDNPYTEKSGSATVMDKDVFDRTVFHDTDTTNHFNRDALLLIAMHGKDLMLLVHELYQKAADEA
jgi:hypothetical protein